MHTYPHTDGMTGGIWRNIFRETKLRKSFLSSACVEALTALIQLVEFWLSQKGDLSVLFRHMQPKGATRRQDRRHVLFAILHILDIILFIFSHCQSKKLIHSKHWPWGHRHPQRFTKDLAICDPRVKGLLNSSAVPYAKPRVRLSSARRRGV